jgi:hypothetical protein
MSEVYALFRHPRERGGEPGSRRKDWIPAFAGMTQTGSGARIIILSDAPMP